MHIFIDTNIFLHFTPLEHVNWLEVVGNNRDEVTLVIPLVVISELDKHKRDPKYAARVRPAIKRIEEAVRSGKLSEAVSVHVITSHVKMATLDEYGLDKGENDDRIIAYILEYRSQHPSEKTVLLTNDSSMKFRASSFGIDILDMPEKYELVIEDENAKEVKSLRKELQLLQASFPRLEVAGIDNQKKIQVDVDALDFDEYKRQQMANTRGKHTPLNEEDIEYLRQAQNLPELARVHIRTYNDRLRSYHTQYEHYLNSCRRQYEFLSLTVEIRLKILNNGSKPAENVDVHLAFPPHLLIRTEIATEFPPEPIPPELYLIAKNIWPASSAPMRNPYGVPQPLSYNVPGDGSLRVEELESETIVQTDLRSLKHNQDFQFDSLYVTFPSYTEAKGFPIKYKVFADNVRDVISGVINVTVAKET